MGRIHNSLKLVRQAAGLSQEALSEAVGISRQAYRNIESEESVPSTEVALRLARALGTSIEQLFALPDAERPAIRVATVGPARPLGSNQRVRLARIGGRLLARPLTGGAGILHTLPWADGVGVPDADDPTLLRVELLHDAGASERTLVMLGCDPAAALLASALQEKGVDLLWTEEGSLAALEGLARGEAHIAGCHLRDPASGAFNLPWVARLLPFPCTIVHFAVWQQGLIVADRNPLQIHGVVDLVRSQVVFVNRGPGSGARALLDAALAGIGASGDDVQGYGRAVPGHLAVAESVRAGFADAGIGVLAAAIVADLAFIPLEEEQYDLVIPNHFLELSSVVALLDVLRRPGLRAQVEALGGYDVASMGQTLSVVPSAA